MTTSPQHRSPSQRWLICAAVVLVVVVLVAQTGVGRHGLRDLGLYRSTESFIALSFTNPSQVADEGVLVPATPPRRVPLAFSVANATPRRAAFAVRVTAAGRLIETAQLKIPARLAATARTTVGPVCVGRPLPQRVRVVVTLIRPVRSIDFWVLCRG